MPRLALPLVCPGVAVLVDPAVWPWRGERWSHLVSDVSYDELHAFAERLGVPRWAFQGDHYDIPERLLARAVALGAQQVRSRELLARLTAAGLRRRRPR
jgi:2-hydroxychromene-2-carboxylate isomerase